MDDDYSSTPAKRIRSKPASLTKQVKPSPRRRDRRTVSRTSLKPPQAAASVMKDRRRERRLQGFPGLDPYCRRTQPQPQMITRQDCDRSINQLLCLILGSQKSRASNHLGYNPAERIEFCFKLVQKRWSKLSVLPTQKPCRRVSATVNASSPAFNP